MGRSMRIGTAFGIGLYVHWSFLVIPLMAVFAGRGEPGGVVLSAGLLLGLFGCVLLHELGHALMARSFGIGTRDITLFPIGGVARLERMSEHPGEEIAIAVAGPLVNVVIAGGLWFGMGLAGLSPFVTQDFMSSGPLAERLLVMLLGANVMLVLFNLIPAFPMDGGRVFRALLSMAFGRLQGTEIAVGFSKILAVLFIGAGILGFVPLLNVPVSPFLAVIGLFVMVAGNQELAMLRYQDQSRHNPMTIDQAPTHLSADRAVQPVQPAQPNYSGFTWDPRAGAWIEWRDGRVVSATYVNGAGQQW
jgi:Zn-dependent protease